MSAPLTRDETQRVAVITGIGGFVGGRLARGLTGAGWRVVGLHRAASSLVDVADLPVDFREADLLDAAAVRRATPAGADVIFHVAGDTGSWHRRNREQWRLNVGATETMLEVARERGTRRFVHTSTVSAWGRHPETIDEHTPSNAEHSWIGYERSKWAAQQRVLSAAASGLDAVLVAPSAIIGPGDRSGWARMFVQLVDGRLQGVPPGTATFNFIDDVVAAHIAAVERGRSGECYLVPGETATFAHLIDLVATELGVPVRSKPMPPLVMKGAARLFALVAAVTGREPSLTPEMAALLTARITIGSGKAQTELGIQPSPLPHAVAQTCRWLADAGLIGRQDHGQ